MRIGKIYIFPLFLIILFLPFSIRSQSPFSCNGSVTTYTANFQSTTSNSITFSNLAAAGVGECCTFTATPTFNCYTFSVTIDQSSLSSQQNGVGVDFTVSGTVAPISIRYNGCSSSTFSAGQDICLTGPGPHWFNVCLENTGPISITVNQLTLQTDVTVCAGDVVPNSNFISSASNLSNYTWTASNPTQIGLPFPSGTGNIGSFPSQNTTANPQTTLTSTVTVTPVGTSLCRSTPFTYKIVVNPSPSANFYAPPNQCFTNNSFPFSSTGNLNGTHAWTFPSATPVTSSSSVNPAAVSWSTPGTYTVTHQVTLGTCTDIETRPVTVYPQPNASVLTADYPNCSTRSILVSPATGGTPDYQYSIDNATFGPLQDYTNLAAGSYTVYIRDANACTNSSTITLQTILGPTDFTLNSTTAHCNQADGTIAISNVVGGTTPYTYSAQSNTTTFPFSSSPNFNAVPPGTYTVTVKDNNGCTFTKNVTIGNAAGPAGPRATAVKSNCGLANGSVTLLTPLTGTVPYTYAFNNNGASFSATTSYPNLLAGTYTYIVKDPFGCSLTGTIVVGDNAGPTALTVNKADAICGGTTGSLAIVTPTTGTSPYTYSVSTISTTFTTTTSFPSVSPANYTVTVKDANNCTYSVTANVGDRPGPSAVSVVTDPTSCSANTGKITIAGITGGTASYTYTINTTPQLTGSLATAASTATHTAIAAGSYTVTVKDANNCTKTQTFTVSTVAGPTDITLSPTTSKCGLSNGSISITNITGGTPTYSTSISTAAATYVTYLQTQNYTGLAAANYTINVKDFNGCVFSKSVAVNNVAGPSTISVTPTAANCGLTNGVITINGITGANSGTAPYNYTITNSSNVAVFTGTGGTATTAVTYSTNVASGSYTIKVVDANGCEKTATTTVNTVGSSITDLNLQSINSTCGNANGQIKINGVSGGGPSYTYTITTVPASTVSIAGSLASNTATATHTVSAGSYSVSIKDGNNCAYGEQVTVTNTPGPTAQAVIVNPSTCGGATGSISIATGSTTGGTNPFVFSINGGTYSSAPTSLTNLAAGQYPVSVKDANNCIYAQTVSVTNTSGPTAVLVTPTAATCSNANGVIKIDGVTGGVAAYTYTINSTTNANLFSGNLAASTSTVSHSAVAAGSYTVTVKDANNCQQSQAVTVNNLAAPTAIQITSVNSTCGNSNGSLNIVNVTGGGSSYSYSLNGSAYSGTTFYTNLAASANYNVSVKDNNGCIYSQTASVVNTAGPTAISVTSFSTTCNSNNGKIIINNVSGGTAPYSYSITLSGNATPVFTGTTATSGSSLTYSTNVSAGNYTVTVNDVNSCTITQAVTVGSQNSPTAIASIVTPSTCGSSNGEIKINSITGGTAPYSISINTAPTFTATASTGSTVVTHNTVAAGTYTISITDANNCTYSVPPTTVTNTGGPSSMTVSPTNSTCGASNGQITVAGVTGGTGALSYSLNNGAYSSSTSFTSLAAANYTVNVKDANNCVYSTTTTVSNTGGPTAVAFVKTDASCGNNNGVISLGNVTGGVGSFQFSLNNGAYSSTTNYSSLAAGTYSYTVKDANNCTYSFSVTISQAGTPTDISLSSINSTCGNANGVITIGSVNNGTSPFTYTVSNSSSTYSPSTSYTNVPAGTQTVSVKDANGCTFEKTIIVNNTSGPSDFVLNPTSATCGNASGSLSIGSVTGGTAPYTYSLSPGTAPYSSSTTFGSLAAGNYTVTVKDANNCTFLKSATITNSNAPTGLTINTTNSTCGNTTGSLTIAAVIGGTAPYFYAINNGAETSTTNYTGLAAGVYTVSVRDNPGCTYSVTATVLNTSGPTDLALSSTNSTCGNSNGGLSIGAVTGGTSAFTYSVTGISNDFSTLTNYTNLSAGTYQVIVKDANNCTFTKPIAVGNTAGPSNIASSVVNTTCGSSNGSITLGAVSGGTGPFTYSISPVSLGYTSTISYTGLTANTYTINVKDGNNCVFTQTTSISNAAGPSAQNFTITPTSCSANTGIIKFLNTTGGNGNYFYQLSGPNSVVYTYTSVATFTGLATGNYTASVKDGNNCRFDTVIAVPVAPGPIAMNVDTVNATCSLANGVITIASVTGGTAPFTYSVTGGVTSGFVADNNFTGLNAGSYNVTVKDANSCIYTVSTSFINKTGPTALTATPVSSKCGNANASITINSVDGGTPPFTYSVTSVTTGFVSTTSFTGINSGNYTVTVRDDNGCIKPLPVNISNIAGPSGLNVGTTNSTCGSANGAINIGAVSGGTPNYQYSINGTTFSSTTSYTGISSGNYTVSVRDNNSCTYTVSAVVLNAATPSSINYTQINSTCGLPNGSITIGSVTGGTPPFVYSLNNGSTSLTTYSNLTGGNYALKVTDANGCVFNQSITLNSLTGPNNQNYVITPSICSSSTGAVQFTSTTGGNGIYTYSFNGSSFSNTINYTGLAPGDYITIVKDGNNCTFEKTVTVGRVDSPTGFDFTPTNATCSLPNGSISVGAVTGGTGPYTYSVSPGVGAYITNNVLTGLGAGNYTVSVKDANGCVFTKTDPVILINIPGPIAINVITTPSRCGNLNGSVNVAQVSTAGPIGNYQYSLNGGLFGNSSLFSGLLHGTYTVTVKDQSNCLIDTTVVVENGAGITSFNMITTNTSCGSAFGSIKVTNVVGGTPYYLYSINGGQLGTDTLFTSLLPGTYTLTVKDINNCEKSLTTVISNSPGPVDFSLFSTAATCSGSNGQITIGSVLGGTPGFQFSLIQNSGSQTAYSPIKVYPALPPGNYTVTVKDTNQCTNNKTITIGSSPGPNKAYLTLTKSSCGSANGTIKVDSVPGASGSLSYSINNSIYSNNNVFSNLVAGTYTIKVKDFNNCEIDTVVVLNNTPGPTAFSDSTINSFCNVTSGKIYILSVAGGVSPYTYSLNNSPFTSNNAFTNLSPGTYLLSVADANLCSFSRSVVIDFVPGPTDLNYLIDTASCGLANGSITISSVTGGAGAYQYALNGGASQFSNSFNLVLPLTHTVLVTDANGCNYQETVNVPNLTGPYAQQLSTINSVCGQINGVVNIGVTNGGTAPYQYSFDGSTLSTTTSYTTSPGTHTVIVSDANQCTYTDSVTVFDVAGPVSFNFTLDSTNCGNPNGSISINGVVSGTIPFQYSLNGLTSQLATVNLPYQTSNNFTNLLAGNYTVTVKDANGCTKELSSVLPDLGTPVVIIDSKRNVTCFGNSNGSLTVSGFGGQRPYVFSLNNGQVNGTGVFNNLAPGNYIITIIDAGNCTSTATFEITSPSAPLDAAIGSTTNVLCNGAATGSAFVSQTGGVTPYMYSLNGSNYSATNQFTSLTAGNYSVSVRDDNGCIVVVPFTITQPGAINLLMSSTNTTCSANNGTVSVAASGGVPPFTYLWSGGGGTNSSAGPLPSGIYSVTVTDAVGCVKINSDTIFTAQNSPAVFSTVRNVSCSGLSDGLLSVSAGQGFTPPFNYTWIYPNTDTVVSVNPTISGLGLGSYTVTVLDANGCSSTIFASISEPLPLNIIFSATNVSCNNGNDGSITANVSGGTTPYTYSWSPGLANTAIATGLSAGTYTLEVNDAKGCRIVRTRSISEPSVIVPNPVVTNPNCQQANGSISLTASGGAGGYSYAINGGNFGLAPITFNGLAAGTYIISVKDQNNCIVSQAVSLTDINGPTAVITSSTNNTCFGGNSGSATVVASGGTPPYTYLWTPTSIPPQAQPTAVNLGAGIYGVTVRDNQGCAASVSVIITEPDSLYINTSGVDPRCNGQSNGSAVASAGGGVAPYTYQWQVLNAPSGPSITGLAFGTHTIKVTDANGCVVNNTITLNNPPLFTANIIKNIPSCNGFSDGSATVVTSNGIGTLVYQWNDQNNQTTQTASGLGSGSYTVNITDFNGCTTAAAVTLTDPPILTSSLANVVNITCAGICDGSAEVIASGGTPNPSGSGLNPYIYSWTNGSTSSQVTGLCATTYSVEVKDSKGCTSMSVLQITSPAPLTLSVTSTDILCHGLCTGTAMATYTGGTAPYSFNWFPSLSTVYNPTALCDGIHSVTITDANGCQLTQSTQINEPAPFTASTNVIGNNLCNQSNGSAQVLVTGGTSPFIYSWNNGSNSAIISSLSGGVYSVDVTDANGCVASAVANVNDLPAPILTLVSSQNITCFGLNDGSASISVSGGTAPVSQTWLLPLTLNANPDQTGNGLLPGNNIFEVVDAAGCISSITVPITEPQQLVGNIAGVVNVSCYNYNDGSATMLVTGGTLPYSYAWNDPASQVSATALGLPAGTFICNVIDANGCTLSRSTLINQPPAFLINVNSITNVRCYGDNDGAISITASGGSPSYTYSWTPSTIGTGPVVNNLSQGSYTLTITDNRGCIQTADYFVSQPDSFNIVSTINPSTCTSPNASITINVTGATPPFIYQWNDPNLQTTNTATGLVAPANYNCLITDSRGCTKVFTASTTDIPAPSIDSIISTPVRCYGGQDGTLTVFAEVSPGGGNLSYQWLNSSNVIIGNGSFQGGLPVGTYNIIITDGNGCTVTGNGNVTQPFPLNITVSQNQTACNGQTLGIYASAGNGTPPYTYNWTGAGTGLTGPGIHNILFTNSTTTSDLQLFNVSATDANNCPAVSGQFFVTVLPKISIVANDNNACFGQNVTLTAYASGGDGAPYQFFWATSPTQTQTGSSSTISIPVLSMNPQSYNLLVSDGCSTSEMTMVDVIPNPKPIPAITAVNTQGCENLDVEFTGSAGTGIIGTNYEWTFGDGTYGLGENTSHIYSLDSLVSDTFDVQLVVTSNLGCKDTILIEDYVIVYPKPIADFITMPSSATEFDPYFEFYNYSILGISYQWNFGDSLSNENTATTTNASHYYLSTGYYNTQLIAITDRGCSDTVSKTVYIEPQSTVYIPNAFTPNKDKKNDVFMPVGIGLDAERYLFQIFDRWGNLVFQTSNPEEGWNGITANGADYFAEGVYIWKLGTYDLKGNKIDRKGRLTLVR